MFGLAFGLLQLGWTKLNLIICLFLISMFANLHLAWKFPLESIWMLLQTQFVLWGIGTWDTNILLSYQCMCIFVLVTLSIDKTLWVAWRVMLIHHFNQWDFLLGLLCWRSRSSCYWTVLQTTWRFESAFLWRFDW